MWAAQLASGAQIGWPEEVGEKLESNSWAPPVHFVERVGLARAYTAGLAGELAPLDSGAALAPTLASQVGPQPD